MKITKHGKLRAPKKCVQMTIKKCVNCGRLIEMKPSEYSAESGINKVHYIESCPYCDKKYRAKQNKGASGSGS